MHPLNVYEIDRECVILKRSNRIKPLNTFKMYKKKTFYFKMVESFD